MQTGGQLDPGWVEIIAPAAPPAALEAWLLWLALAAGGLLLVALLVYLRRPRSRALRGLRRLARELRTASIEPRQASHGIKAALKQAWAVDDLRQVSMDSVRHNHWQIFRHRLNELTFAAEAPGRAEAEIAIREARGWIREADRR